MQVPEQVKTLACQIIFMRADRKSRRSMRREPVRSQITDLLITGLKKPNRGLIEVFIFVPINFRSNHGEAVVLLICDFGVET